MIDANYTDDLALLAITPAQAESLLHSLEGATGSIGVFMNENNKKNKKKKTEYMCFKQKRTISTTSKPLKLVDQFT